MKRLMILLHSAKPPSVASRHLPPYREKEKHNGPGRGSDATIELQLFV